MINSSLTKENTKNDMLFESLVSIIIVLPLLVGFLPLLNLLPLNSITYFLKAPPFLRTLLAIMYLIVSVFVLIYGCYKRKELSNKKLISLCQLSGVMAGITLCMQLFFDFHPDYLFIAQNDLSAWDSINQLSQDFIGNLFNLLPIMGTILFSALLRKFFKRQSSTHEKTSGKFGSASWATYDDLEKMGAYDKKTGPFVGTDNRGKSLYLPLLNKAIVAPPGEGKTSSAIIPGLLSYDGPLFALDVRAELLAVTIRYRSLVMRRKSIIIDPFGVTTSPDFARVIPSHLLKRQNINPFDWIPEDKKSRDRMINAFASSFVINEGGYAKHFDENAKILIRGYIDYLMNLNKPERTLSNLYRLMTENTEDADLTFKNMTLQEGRAKVAANQIMRVGPDERGSILSTSYRQIDWMGDSNIQEALSHSSFDLREFLQGNMDIFVVLPEDQIKEHGRLFRMILSLLMGMIVQANPSELPGKKMLFLLEELAQLGYCPDVEQCIEILRARGVVVWTVFQTLSQIEQFQKPDLFKGMPIKQIFTNDDTETMQWIQILAGKETYVTKTSSTNTGGSRPKMQLAGGTVSTGVGESIHETGVDLIQLNEIRELPKDEQLIFMHGSKPIHCKKVRYFECPEFAGKFDANPLENRNH
jgi:type IV secretion system protein VirD4